MQETPYFPLFINLEGKKIVVFGAGKIALRRVRTLQFFHTEITVIAREIPDDLQERSELRLSDAYETKSGTVDLELKVLVLNINPGYNDGLMRIYWQNS